LRALPDLGQRIDDPVERVAKAVRAGAEWTLGREARLRMILRASLDPASPAPRPARRRGYIAALLEPIDLPPAVRERLAASLTLLFGIDPIVSLVDNGDIERERIPDALAWTARRLGRGGARRSRAGPAPERPPPPGIRGLTAGDHGW
jgi:hypothetical protein